MKFNPLKSKRFTLRSGSSIEYISCSSVSKLIGSEESFEFKTLGYGDFIECSLSCIR
jgi:hypothetical protein